MTSSNDRLRIKIPAESKTRLENFGEDFAEVERALQALEKTGMDTTAIKDKLQWARDTADILLKEFG